ncbi:Mannosyl-glycoprotein endo-beta-N-acetylglucosamidase-like domain containing protein [uncultured Caudovirales phage]|uniref:Mannosyl-glycoprotein endo-beta-N-acetylglucosamidase-like domain containing protein n=1 Tax=uncultured Caudovirales phage TaxID=2100421 RepID=A0A6J5M286_9CAUD|nr:Mannosyl-glycoprotein endo-beta-N-acetylglucosamidase-like domain containing protein [uncultured Caudovirales phage]
MEPSTLVRAVSILESQDGARPLKSVDGVDSNNLFGIKASPNWEGKTVEAWTTEYVDNKPVKVKAKFRAYDNRQDSINDFVSLIERRYPKAYAALQEGDAEAFAKGMIAGGYATDPAYVEKLMGAIKRAEKQG